MLPPCPVHAPGGASPPPRPVHAPGGASPRGAEAAVVVFLWEHPLHLGAKEGERLYGFPYGSMYFACATESECVVAYQSMKVCFEEPDPADLICPDRDCPARQFATMSELMWHVERRCQPRTENINTTFCNTALGVLPSSNGSQHAENYRSLCEGQ